MGLIRLIIVDTINNRKAQFECPDNIIVQRVLEKLAHSMRIPLVNEAGDPYIFELVNMRDGRKISLLETLAESQVQPDDTLQVVMLPSQRIENWEDDNKATETPVLIRNEQAQVLPLVHKSTGTRVFLSYRRSDSGGYAGRIFDRLSAKYGAKQIFMDIDTIKPGVDFVDAIESAVGNCAVLVAIIGKDWLTTKNDGGQRRLDDPNDFVRVEISTALARNIPVIPVLVGKASVPTRTDLPESLARLARFNAIEVSDERFHTDVDRLITALEEFLTLVGHQETPHVSESDPKADSDAGDNTDADSVQVITAKSKRVKVDILIMNYAKRYTVELPAFAPVKKLIPPLVAKLELPTHMANGWPVEYRLRNQSHDLTLRDELTLEDNGVKDGDTLVFYVDMVAG